MARWRMSRDNFVRRQQAMALAKANGRFCV